MKVRALKAEDDLSGAIQLLQDFFREEGFETPPHVIATRTKAMSGLDICLLLLAEDDSGAIGVATLSSEFGIEFGWWAELGDLYVVPAARGKGVATALLAAGEAWMRQRGISGYQVTVTPIGEEHHALIGYYRKLGFDTEGRLLYTKTL